MFVFVYIMQNTINKGAYTWVLLIKEFLDFSCVVVGMFLFCFGEGVGAGIVNHD